jgi:hypothetical protein
MLFCLCKISVITVVVSTEELEESFFYLFFCDKPCPENTQAASTGVKITSSELTVANF